MSVILIPEKWRLIIKLNPAYYIVNGYRDSMLYHISVFDHGLYTLYFWCIVIILLIIGTNVFNKLKPHFADVL